MVLSSVFHIHASDTDEDIKSRIRVRMRNNEKWFGVKYSENDVDVIFREMKSHTQNFVLIGESYRLTVCYSS